MRSQPIVLATMAFALVLMSCVSVETRKPVEKIDWLFDSILFEVAPIVSAMPSQEALNEFREKIHQSRICDQMNVRFEIHASDYPPPYVPWWDSQLLVFYEAKVRRYRDLDPTDRNLVCFIPYLRGLWISGRRIYNLAGIKYSSTSFGVFKDGAKGRESSVLLHEFGHVIGLVDDTDAPNHDDDHPLHCAIKTCAMYWYSPGPGAVYDDYCMNKIRKKIRERKQKLIR